MVNGGETLADKGRPQVPQVEVDRQAGSFPLHENGSCEHIPRAQFTQWMVFLGKPFSIMVNQICAFTSHRLGDQEGISARREEYGRVKLKELQVTQDSAGPVSHRQSVTGTLIGAG